MITFHKFHTPLYYFKMQGGKSLINSPLLHMLADNEEKKSVKICIFFKNIITSDILIYMYLRMGDVFTVCHPPWLDPAGTFLPIFVIRKMFFLCFVYIFWSVLDIFGFCRKLMYHFQKTQSQKVQTNLQQSPKQN